MTEHDIITEMQAIEMTLRALKVRKGGKRLNQSHFDEARLLEKRHAELARMLQVYQLKELKGKKL